MQLSLIDAPNFSTYTCNVYFPFIDNICLRHFRGLGFLNGSYMLFACWIQKCIISLNQVKFLIFFFKLMKKIIKIFVFLISIFFIQNQTYIDRKCTNYTYNDAQVHLMWNKVPSQLLSFQFQKNIDKSLFLATPNFSRSSSRCFPSSF